ncbi:Cip1 possible oxidoreductase [Candida orthopsilosis Co 90-125]|uniref:Cip1 possible oxidoreductase n=1 Tax=Candida orthopsilosis (strain 90-125) TaxID=1136231 RepID=H8XB10_CANO9|nr:Cip1 possible oxidoreductase [Candida orthopsilosis Co 90-125]CCG25258.1 Cip1 possible oxidoreductase [Candida orthopsilosis Co 90-125]
MSKASIAIIGLNGFLGKHVVNAINSGVFDSKIQFPIKAITRKEGSKSTDKIEYVVSAETSPNDSHLIDSLKGIDAIVELTGPNPELFSNIEKIVEKVKPKLFIPSQFGTDIPQVDTYAPGFLTLKSQHSEAVRKLGVKVVDVITSLFAVPGAFLYDWVGAVGITEQGVNLIGDIDQKFNISKLEDVGNVVLAVATHQPYSDLPDLVHVVSDTITVKDVIEKYEKSKGIKLNIVSKRSAEEGKKEFIDKLNAGFNPNDFLFYLQVIVAQGLDKGLYFSKLDNELFNPKESLWKWGKF